MKKNIFTIAIIAIIFVFTSCENNELATNEPQKNNKTDILTFATQEDFDKTLVKVNAMTKEERLAWEKEQGFKSFGTICDEFYATIDPKSFKSVEEVKAFVARNSDKIEFYTSSDGETYCVTKDFKYAKRYLTNKFNEYQLGTNIVSESEQLSKVKSNKMYKATSAFITSDEIIDENKIGSNTYRMHIWINTYNRYAGYSSFVQNELKLSNFARWLGIWWERTYSTEYRITLKTTDDAYGLLTAGNGNNTITENIKSKYILNSYDNLIIGGGPILTNPHLVSYSIYSKNAKGCLINQNKTY